MGGIFISYRRGDSAPYARLLRDDLGDRFGSDLIFRDIDNIRPGAKFAEVIDQAIEGCSAFIALIGDEWLTVSDDAGARRLDNPDDYVRLEITSALERNVLIVPVLIESAEMPDADALPPPLRPLVMRQAVVLTDAGWKHQVQQLIDALGSVVVTPVAAAPPPPAQTQTVAPPPTAGATSKIPRRPLTLAIVAALMVLAVLLVKAVVDDDPPIDSAQSPLTTVQLADSLVLRPGSGFEVKVPGGWGDPRHFNVAEEAGWVEEWTDPADPNRKVRVLGSGCGPCATDTEGRANAFGVVPAGADKPLQRSNNTRAFYEVVPGANPYRGHGLIKVFPVDAAPQGYYRVEVWLPEADRRVTTDILNSFTLT